MGCDASKTPLPASPESLPIAPTEKIESNRNHSLEKTQIQFRSLELYTLLWIDEKIQTKLDLQS